MSQANVETVRRLYAAFGRGDLSVALDEISPEIVLHQAESLPYGGTYHGHDGFKKFATKFGATWEQPITAVEEFIDAGD